MLWKNRVDCNLVNGIQIAEGRVLWPDHCKYKCCDNIREANLLDVKLCALVIG
jgi:hypothetical protein